MTDHILIVDDDVVVADTLRQIFEMQGFAATAAYSASEGLRKARELQPCLLVCDVTMPEKSGLDLVDEIALELPECRVIVLTAYLSNLVKARTHVATMPQEIKVMSKPCAPAELLREAGEMLRRAS